MKHRTFSDTFRRPVSNPNQNKSLIVFRFGSFFFFFLRNRTFFLIFSNFLMRCHVSEWIVSEHCAARWHRGSRKSGVSGDDATSRKFFEASKDYATPDRHPISLFSYKGLKPVFQSQKCLSLFSFFFSFSRPMNVC